MLKTTNQKPPLPVCRDLYKEMGIRTEGGNLKSISVVLSRGMRKSKVSYSIPYYFYDFYGYCFTSMH